MTSQDHGHGHGHGHDGAGRDWNDFTVEELMTKEYWDGRYASSESVWSGKPNPSLVEQTSDLTPGRALEVGAGEGADAIWLAQQGWDVLATELSSVAVERALGHAETAGVKVDFQQADLFSWVPPESAFDLVTAHYVHVPKLELDALNLKLAAAVRPGGVLLVVGHSPVDASEMPPELASLRFTPESVAEVLDPAEWDVTVVATTPRQHDHHGHIHDSVLRATRRP